MLTASCLANVVLPEPGTPYKKNTFLYGIPNDKYSFFSSSEKNSSIEFVINSFSFSFKYNVSIGLFGILEKRYQYSL